jgi:hypothetical protein
MEYSPERGLYVGDATLVETIGRVGLRVWGWDRNETEAGRVWERKLDLSLSYTNHSQDAQQIFSTYTSSKNPGEVPKLSRGMNTPPNGFEDINEEHLQESFPVPDDAIIAFVGICRTVFTQIDFEKLKESRRPQSAEALR